MAGKPETTANFPQSAVNYVANAPSAEETGGRAAVTGVVVGASTLGIDINSLIPGGLAGIERMTRVQTKETFRSIVEQMISSKDPNTQTMGLMFGLLTKDAMQIKFSDRVKDALEAFAKGVGKWFAAAAAAVSVAIIAAKDAIVKLWDKTKPARDKIAEVLGKMVDKIIEVTAPVREKAVELARKAGAALSATGRAIIDSAPARIVMHAAHEAGISVKYLFMRTTAAVGAKLATTGAKMQASHTRATEAAKKIQGAYRTFSTLPEEEKARLRDIRKSIKTAKAAAPKMTPKERQKAREGAQSKLDAKRGI